MKNINPFILVLGIAQDGGIPHAGCYKKCCLDAWKNPSQKKHVSCLAIVDPASNEKWIIDATPDFKEQLYMLNKIATNKNINGILLTHGHIGHYTGLTYLGKEVMNTKLLTVYAASKMTRFLSNNLPWKSLVKNKNIKIRVIKNSIAFKLNTRIKITPFKIPHREEFTETLGFRIEGPNKSVVYIPDIDNWEKWERRLEDMVYSTERLYIDGTFYSRIELPHRSISKIPHPFIIDSIELLKSLPNRQKNKVHFIHLNHTNPALKPNSFERKIIEKKGFNIAGEMSKLHI